MKQDIIVATTPRSGTTWLVRLLSDALRSGSVAIGLKHVEEPIFYGPHEYGDYLIRMTYIFPP